MKWLRNGLIALLIKILEKDLRSDLIINGLTEEQYRGLLSQLWDNPAFRKYLGERETKIVFAIAGVAGNEPEPRDKTRIYYGQRVENLVLAARAKACAEERNQRIKEKKTIVDKRE